MREYVKPIVLENEELAEGVYAASGAGVGDDVGADECWSVTVAFTQAVTSSGYANFRVIANHPQAEHISTATNIEIVFNQAVTDASFEGFTVESVGETVKLVRSSHANAYMAGDNFDSLLMVYCPDPETIRALSATIYCTKVPNVQGGF